MLSDIELDVLDCLSSRLTVVSKSGSRVLWENGPDLLGRMANRGLLDRDEVSVARRRSVERLFHWRPGEQAPSASLLGERLAELKTAKTVVYRLSAFAANLLACDHQKKMPTEDWTTGLAVERAYLAFREQRGNEASFCNLSNSTDATDVCAWAPDAVVLNGDQTIDYVIHTLTTGTSQIEQLHQLCEQEGVGYELW